MSKDVKNYLTNARIAIKNKFFDVAKTHIDQVLKLDPENIDAHKTLRKWTAAVSKRSRKNVLVLLFWDFAFWYWNVWIWLNDLAWRFFR